MADFTLKIADITVEPETQIVLIGRKLIQVLNMIDNPQPSNNKFIAARILYQQKNAVVLPFPLIIQSDARKSHLGSSAPQVGGC